MDAFHTFLTKIEDQILTPIIAVVALAALILFVFGIVTFIRNAGDATKRAEGQQQMIWGIVGLAFMFGASALVAIIKHTVGAP
jgi:cytosine/uracil/thiamine/allantoin permease